jgi:hypothetical protein
MAENKKSFLLYTDVHHTVKKLTDEQAGILFKHILSYVNDENPVLSDFILEIAFEPIKQSLKRDLKRYESICLRNKENGQKGGRPKQKPKKPSGLNGNPKNPVGADSDSDSDNGIGIDKERYIIPPPVFLITKYCKERNNGIDANYFYDWYQTRGWKVGKDKMKDWQSAIRTWEQRNKKEQKTEATASFGNSKVDLMNPR